MDVTQTSSAGTPRATTQTDGLGSSQGLSSDFETFLRMLTAQMTNQDPLNPLESSDFAVQLATFSSVEQQVRTNELLVGLNDSMGGAISQYAGWIGKIASAAASARLDGAPIAVETPAHTSADEAFLVVRNELGKVVDRVSVDPGGGPVIWSGKTPEGQDFLPGLYTFSTEFRESGTYIEEAPALIEDRVIEVRRAANGGVELVLAGGGVANSSDLDGLRLDETASVPDS